MSETVATKAMSMNEFFKRLTNNEDVELKTLNILVETLKDEKILYWDQLDGIQKYVIKKYLAEKDKITLEDVKKALENYKKQKMNKRLIEESDITLEDIETLIEVFKKHYKRLGFENKAPLNDNSSLSEITKRLILATTLAEARVPEILKIELFKRFTNANESEIKALLTDTDKAKNVTEKNAKDLAKALEDELKTLKLRKNCIKPKTIEELVDLFEIEKIDYRTIKVYVDDPEWAVSFRTDEVTKTEKFKGTTITVVNPELIRKFAEFMESYKIDFRYILEDPFYIEYEETKREKTKTKILYSGMDDAKRWKSKWHEFFEKLKEKAKKEKSFESLIKAVKAVIEILEKAMENDAYLEGFERYSIYKVTHVQEGNEDYVYIPSNLAAIFTDNWKYLSAIQVEKIRKEVKGEWITIYKINLTKVANLSGNNTALELIEKLKERVGMAESADIEILNKQAEEFIKLKRGKEQ